MSSKKPKKPLYEQSTQFRHWRFSSSQLENIRTQTNTSTVERVKRLLTEELTLRETEQTDSPRPPPEEIPYLTADEELALCRYYEAMIRNFPGANFPDEVKATAIVYMKRFYLRNSIMDYHPKTIMMTCLFLGAKTENNIIAISDFLNIIERISREKISRDTIFRHELPVSQSMRFEYAVHHPYRASFGFFLDLQNFTKDLTKLKRIYEKSKEYIGTSLLTDLVFTYQPSQIALATIRMATKTLEAKLDINGYIRSKFPDKHEKFTDILNDIENTLTNFSPVSKDQAKEIDRKLHFCRNPEKNPNSALSKKRRADKEREREVRKTKKSKTLRDRQKELESVFQ
ncbi:3834_t:CDS:2 [Paraglomus occultum]|uniref:3834_t:CDS:1 n=1 Tax=Paraglomus occultum TaxID=144539 RepID=A0A9N9C0W8_9GLOM|nr:3834_t:CDS:2 [Paraglomus occultum]